MHARPLAAHADPMTHPVVAELERLGSAPSDVEFRTFDYTRGWDEEDADLGWVDADVVRGSRRLH